MTEMEGDGSMDGVEEGGIVAGSVPDRRPPAAGMVAVTGAWPDVVSDARLDGEPDVERDAEPDGGSEIGLDESAVGVGRRILRELAEAGVVLLNGGVPPEPAQVRTVQIPVGEPVSRLIDELGKLPADAVFAEASGDADVVVFFYIDVA